jgi:hypothetical protein
MSEHSILAPSSAAMRKACPGSRAMQERYPETEESQASRDGTAAHWGAAELFAGRTIDVGLVAPNGVMLTDEMVEAATMYFDDVVDVWRASPGFAPAIEQRVAIDTIHPECWGTPDAWLFKPYTLYVWDFKFGHRFVDVFENWQLIEYTAGILEKVGINGISDQRTEVVFRIVQPRCYVGGSPIREWRVNASDLRTYFNELRASEERSMDPDAPLIVNQHCRDCTARHACVALQTASYSAMEYSQAQVAFDLPPAALGVELRMIDRAIRDLEARQSALQVQALSAIQRGEMVPFYQAEQGMGRERWNVPDEQVVTMASLMGVDVTKRKLVTPKQAIKAGLDAATVKAFSETPRGEVKLKEFDDSVARKIFS